MEGFSLNVNGITPVPPVFCGLCQRNVEEKTVVDHYEKKHPYLPLP